jgi:peptide-methionine (S)-S-oxide reductase
MGLFSSKASLPSPEAALPGREEPLPFTNQHYVNDHPIREPFPTGLESAVFGMGCFWGAERCFWELDGVFATAVGYSAGYTPNPTYQEVCSVQTGHNVVVRVIFDPAQITYAKLLQVFWESHDPTQGMGQGNDSGTQYRSGVYSGSDEQQHTALQSRDEFQGLLTKDGHGQITTEVVPSGPFYYAEDYHQQYLAKNPGGYCGLGGTGVSFCQPS